MMVLFNGNGQSSGMPEDKKKTHILEETTLKDWSQ